MSIIFEVLTACDRKDNRRHDNLCFKVSSVFASSQLSSGQTRSFTNCGLFKTGAFVLLLYAF
ncbi:PREDICTED: mRNAion termination factor MTERF9 chloroplastic isoform X2 [Prunus dulcis]|uniref:PREDICTED: mRNAion termination factor MTERF9 chloroplastic isoform X2 n=1 Tax=Prunus dulcis TaxID=3755 RepID=A0A5E4G6M7_PRUDU|nr:PREDICTED: mRNAion termination factor MTERF9 chloroplastic isoform X2 [Prunus dulcis]